MAQTRVMMMSFDVTRVSSRQYPERLSAGSVAHGFLSLVLAQARAPALLSGEHCTVEGLPIGAWAGRSTASAAWRSPRAPG
jgi:hypothetical protein